MPYSKNSQLPEPVRNVLPAEAQTVWRQAFNAAERKGWDESRCARYAWGAVKRNWKKDEKSGKWVKKTEQAVCTSVDEARRMNKHREPLRARWEAGARLEKAYEENGELYLVIVASDTGPDRQGGIDVRTGKQWVAERVSENFLRKMKQQAEEGTIELSDGHASGMPMGFVVGTVDLDAESPYPTFAPVVRIEKDSATGVQLWKAAHEGRYERGFSIGGYVDSTYLAHDPEAGGLVKWLDDGELTHIATCRPDEPANPRTGLVEAMVKALREVDDNPPVVEAESTVTKDIEVIVDGASVATDSPPEDLPAEREVTADDIQNALRQLVWALPENDFNTNLRELRVRLNLPLLEELFSATLDSIVHNRELGIDEKRQATIRTVEQYYDVLRALVEGDGEPLAMRRQDTMSIDKEVLRAALAEILDERAEQEKTLSIGEVIDSLAELDEEQRARVAMALIGPRELAKYFVPTPTLDASGMNIVNQGIEESETLTGTVELVKTAVTAAIEPLVEQFSALVTKMEQAEAAQVEAATETEAATEAATETETEAETETESDSEAEDEENTPVNVDELAAKVASAIVNTMAKSTDSKGETESLEPEETRTESDDELEKTVSIEGLRKAIQSGQFDPSLMIHGGIKGVDADGNIIR